MYRQPAVLPHATASGGWRRAGVEIAQSGQLEVLITLERIGTRLRFARDQEIYAEGDRGGCWFKVVSGTVRIVKLLADGRRQVAEFCFAGDSFGREGAEERSFSAEAVGDATVLRLPRACGHRAADRGESRARPPSARGNAEEPRCGSASAAVARSDECRRARRRFPCPTRRA